MADFDTQRAIAEQRSILDRVDVIYKRLQSEVVNYYWDKESIDQEAYYEHLRAIYRYLRDADHDLEKILDEMDKVLEY